MTLELSLSHQFETFSLQVDIQASDGGKKCENG